MIRKRLAPFSGINVNAGFTLLEIMVAIAIIAIVLVGVYRLYTQSIRMTGSAEFFTRAGLLAQEILTRVDMDTDKPPMDDVGDFGDDSRAYTWKLKVESVESDIFREAETKPSKIEIGIYYNDDEQVYTLRTYRWYAD